MLTKGVDVNLPTIIQAGMGIGVSGWVLAQALGRAGHMGVVSGTAVDSLLVRRLQQGDVGGHIARALEAFPVPAIANRIYNKYFVAGGVAPGHSFMRLPMLTAQPQKEQIETLIVANFVEVYLAKQGHERPIGVNFLEKIQLPVLPSLYGAMLAGVDVVLMGAGIPREIPSVIDQLVSHQEVHYNLNVQGALAGEQFQLRFDPREVMPTSVTQKNLKRPKFYAIISSNVLATTLAKRIAKPVDGFIIEAPTAGGHNAPPRGKGVRNERGEPVYGQRDEVDFAAIAELGLPFWLAGSRGSPEGLREALRVGAQGIQVGTAFALCAESGLDSELKAQLRRSAVQGGVDVYTDPVASPTGFPFKVARMPGTLGLDVVAAERPRCCDLGYLREPYRKADGGIGYRCASEPVDNYARKGGLISETVGRKCLCNGLFAALGMGQAQVSGYIEKPILTMGDDVNHLRKLIRAGQNYSAEDVIRYLLEPVAEAEVENVNRISTTAEVVL